jgi:hypothetical protein
MNACGVTALEAGAEGFLSNGPDGARAATALRVTAETAKNLFDVARKCFHAVERAANIVVGDDVTGTDNHGPGMPSVMRITGYSSARKDAKEKTAFSRHSKVAAFKLERV